MKKAGMNLARQFSFIERVIPAIVVTLVLLFSLLGNGSAFAQTSSGTILGRIVDKSGAAV
jgi:hypothetical protein